MACRDDERRIPDCEVSMKALLLSVPVLALVITGDVRAQTGAALAERSGCLDCHRVDRNAIGPAFRSVAARYNADVKNYDLSFLSVPSPRNLPESRKAEVIVARVGDD